MNTQPTHWTLFQLIIYQSKLFGRVYSMIKTGNLHPRDTDGNFVRSIRLTNQNVCEIFELEATFNRGLWITHNLMGKHIDALIINKSKSNGNSGSNGHGRMAAAAVATPTQKQCKHRSIIWQFRNFHQKQKARYGRSETMNTCVRARTLSL